MILPVKVSEIRIVLLSILLIPAVAVKTSTLTAKRTTVPTTNTVNVALSPLM